LKDQYEINVLVSLYAASETLKLHTYRAVIAGVGERLHLQKRVE
jgi:hypothetical protein